MSVECGDLGSQFDPKEPYLLDGSVYAWGKTARLIAEPAYLGARDQTNGDFIAVDLCSSFPYFREIMTGQHKQTMHTQARGIVGKFVDGFFRGKIRLSTELDKDALVLFRKKLAPKHGLNRELLTAPIFEIMANPPQLDKRDNASISKTLLEKFMHSKTHYEFVYEPTGKPTEKGTWVFIKPVQSDATLQEITEPILKDKTLEFLTQISEYFCEQLASGNKLRRITFLSLDIAPLADLIRDAKKGFPPKLQNTLFFQSAQEPKRHICADLKRIQFKKNGIRFFSSIEGWPYYGGGFGLDSNIDIARRIASQLAKGGKAVFFPWNMQEDYSFSQKLLEDYSFSQKLLCKIEREWLGLGLTIDKTIFTTDQLLTGMTDRELVLANHSPILRQTGAIQSLILSKPSR